MTREGDKALREKLLASGAVAALSHERRVATSIAQHGWLTRHSVYYEDIDTRKRREVDVVGTQRWRIDRDTIAVLKLVVECKSAKDWSVVFSAIPDDGHPYMLPSWSVADHTVTRVLLHELLDLGLTENLAEDAKKALFGEIESRRKRNTVEPFPPALAPLGSSYVETNTDQTKDPEASVTWRAAQALTAAITSFQRIETRQQAAEISSQLRLGINDEFTIPQAILKAVSALVGIREYYHPIIVTQAPLWLLDTTIDKVSWCRCELADKSHGRMAWYDVVHAESLAEYLELISSGYRNQLTAAGARLDA